MHGSGLVVVLSGPCALTRAHGTCVPDAHLAGCALHACPDRGLCGCRHIGADPDEDVQDNSLLGEFDLKITQLDFKFDLP
jgi:hypothetical protein